MLNDNAFKFNESYPTYFEEESVRVMELAVKDMKDDFFEENKKRDGIYQALGSLIMKKLQLTNKYSLTENNIIELNSLKVKLEVVNEYRIKNYFENLIFNMEKILICPVWKDVQINVNNLNPISFKDINYDFSLTPTTYKLNLLKDIYIWLEQCYKTCYHDLLFNEYIEIIWMNHCFKENGISRAYNSLSHHQDLLAHNLVKGGLDMKSIMPIFNVGKKDMVLRRRLCNYIIVSKIYSKQVSLFDTYLKIGDSSHMLKYHTNSEKKVLITQRRNAKIAREHKGKAIVKLMKNDRPKLNLEANEKKNIPARNIMTVSNTSVSEAASVIASKSHSKIECLDKFRKTMTFFKGVNSKSLIRRYNLSFISDLKLTIIEAVILLLGDRGLSIEAADVLHPKILSHKAAFTLVLYYHWILSSVKINVSGFKKGDLDDKILLFLCDRVPFEKSFLMKFSNTINRCILLTVLSGFVVKDYTRPNNLVASEFIQTRRRAEVVIDSKVTCLATYPYLSKIDDQTMSIICKSKKGMEHSYYPYGKKKIIDDDEKLCIEPEDEVKKYIPISLELITTGNKGEKLNMLDVKKSSRPLNAEKMGYKSRIIVEDQELMAMVLEEREPPGLVVIKDSTPDIPLSLVCNIALNSIRSVRQTRLLISELRAFNTNDKMLSDFLQNNVEMLQAHQRFLKNSRLIVESVSIFSLEITKCCYYVRKSVRELKKSSLNLRKMRELESVRFSSLAPLLHQNKWYKEHEVTMTEIMNDPIILSTPPIKAVGPTAKEMLLYNASVKRELLLLEAIKAQEAKIQEKTLALKKLKPKEVRALNKFNLGELENKDLKVRLTIMESDLIDLKNKNQAFRLIHNIQ
jgi:hypothetical protein